MHSRLVKPKVSEVKEWILMVDNSNPIAKVYYADIDDAFIKVIPKMKGYKIKYFYGENAWSDSRRYAGDVYSTYINRPQEPSDTFGGNDD